MSRSLHRARPQTDEPVISAAIARTASKSPTEAIGNPASMTSTPSAASASHLELLGHVHARARRLLAVTQRRVENPNPAATGVRRRRGRISGCVTCSWIASFLGFSCLINSHGSRRRISSPATPCRGEPEANKRSPEIHQRGGSRGFVGCIRVRTRRTLKYPPRPAGKAQAQDQVKSKARRHDSHLGSPNAVARTAQPSNRIICSFSVRGQWKNPAPAGRACTPASARTAARSPHCDDGWRERRQSVEMSLPAVVLAAGR